MNKKRILIVINNLGVGGAERLVIDDINEMLKKGIDVHLLLLKPEFNKSLQDQCFIGDDKKNTIYFTGFFDFNSWRKMLSFLRQTQPDLVVSHLWFSNTISRISCFLVGIKNIICFEQNVYDTVKTKKMFVMDFLLQFFCKKIIAVSYAVKKSLIKKGILSKKIDVIHSGVDVDFYSKGKSIRGLLGIDDNVFVFVFVGRLIQQKGVDTLIKSFAQVKDGILLVVGQGKDREQLEQLVTQSGLQGKIFFLGVRDDIPDILKSSDCFVFPSRYEGVGLVFLEAMSAGLPVIITNFDAGIEIVENNRNGLVVPIDNVELLANAMNKVLKDKGLRTKISSQGRKDVEKFSIQSHVNNILYFCHEF